LLQAIVIDPSNDIGFHAGNANRIARPRIQRDHNERMPKRVWIENMNDEEPNISTTSNSFHERRDSSFFADLARLAAIELGIFKKVGVPVKEHSFAVRLLAHIRSPLSSVFRLAAAAPMFLLCSHGAESQDGTPAKENRRWSRGCFWEACRWQMTQRIKGNVTGTCEILSQLLHASRFIHG